MPQSRWFVRKDLDGFFGLMVDNLIQLVLVVGLCRELIHLPDGYIFSRVLPGAAISILIGNLFYAWQARQLAHRSGREDVTALPYGINTVSLFAFVFFIMVPVYQESGDPIWAWKVGLVACFLSGVIEILGAFVAEHIRRVTPRAALLSALSGIAITFISMDFTFRIFARPVIALLPMAVIFLAYFSRRQFPFGLPGGMAAVAIGTLLAWITGLMPQSPAFSLGGFALPTFVGSDLWEAMNSEALYGYMSIILPMGIFNVVGSLQNIESAKAAGDDYPICSSLTVNGLGSISAALFGSMLPTTIYIGHPGWKQLGARSAYSTLNGAFITFLCITGSVQLVLRYVPLEAGVGILLYIGIVIMAQSFQETPKSHAPAVALGIVPALAAWGLAMVESGLRAAGTSLFAVGTGPFGESPAIDGMIALQQGFIFTSMILGAIGVALIERQFLRAALWALAAALLSVSGVIHSYVVTPAGVISRFGFLPESPYATGYAMLVLFFLMMAWLDGRERVTTESR